MRRLLASLAVTGFFLATAPTAVAVPILQLYVEGATYDDATESWSLSGGGTIRLWTIGNVSGPGGAGTIYDVRLALAYEAGGTPVFTLTPSTTGGYGGFTDPSIAPTATYIQTVTDGSVPLLGDGSELPSHGEYGDDTWWQEYSLGDFTLTDSPIADFIDAFPSASTPSAGQISVYEISVANFEGTIHFDLYDHVQARRKVVYKFAPFSHDAETGNPIPEPGTLALLGAGLATAFARVRSRRNRLRLPRSV